MGGDVVRFVGLQSLVRMCKESDIRAIERLNRGDRDVVIRGSFEAVGDLQLSISKVMSQKQSSTAFKLAFVPNSSIPLSPTTTVDDKVAASGPEIGVHSGSRWGGPGIRPPNGAEEAAGHTEDSRQVNAEGNLDVGRQLWAFQFEQTRKTWRIVQLRAAKRIEDIQKDFLVNIRSETADEKVKVIIDGQSVQNIERTCSILSSIVEEIEPQITEEVVPLGECTDVKWLQKVNWKAYKVFYSLTEGNSHCVITGLKSDVDRAKRKIKSKAAKSDMSAATKSVSFRLQTGQQIVIKQAEINSEEVDAIVAVASPDLQTKGGAVVTDSGEFPGRVLVQVVIPSDSSTGSVKSSNEEQIWNACYNSLQKADEKKCTVVAIPCIGTRLLHGKPKEACARSLIGATEKFFKDSTTTSISEVRLVDADIDTYHAFARTARGHFPVSSEIAEKARSTPRADLGITPSGPDPVKSSEF